MLCRLQAEDEVKTFLSKEHTLVEFEAMIMKYKDIALEIPMVMEHTIIIGMYVMQRSSLINTLQETAKKFKDQLVSKLNHIYQTNCRLIGEEYQAIAEKLLTVPANTAELMDLIAYAKEVDTKILPSMEERLANEVMAYFLFIIDHIDLSGVELKQNNTTFQWYLKMHKILDENRILVDAKTLEYQKSLEARIQKFVEDLDVYKRKVDALEYNGDLSKIDKYTQVATSLDNRLVQAMTTIDEFNAEEDSFGWELSQYPLRKQIHDKLRPFKTLYDNCSDFLTKQQLWLNSQIGSYDPEDIETDVGVFYRNVYKLEKQFSEKPPTRDLAQSVSKFFKLPNHSITFYFYRSCFLLS